MSYLAGDYQGISPVCENWHDMAWAHLHCEKDRLCEDGLLDLLASSSSKRFLYSGCSIPFSRQSEGTPMDCIGTSLLPSSTLLVTEKTKGISLQELDESPQLFADKISMIFDEYSSDENFSDRLHRILILVSIQPSKSHVLFRFLRQQISNFESEDFTGDPQDKYDFFEFAAQVVFCFVELAELDPITISPPTTEDKDYIINAFVNELLKNPQRNSIEIFLHSAMFLEASNFILVLTAFFDQFLDFYNGSYVEAADSKEFQKVILKLVERCPNKLMIILDTYCTKTWDLTDTIDDWSYIRHRAMSVLTFISVLYHYVKPYEEYDLKTTSFGFLEPIVNRENLDLFNYTANVSDNEKEIGISYLGIYLAHMAFRTSLLVLLPKSPSDMDSNDDDIGSISNSWLSHKIVSAIIELLDNRILQPLSHSVLKVKDKFFDPVADPFRVLEDRESPLRLPHTENEKQHEFSLAPIFALRDVIKMADTWKALLEWQDGMIHASAATDLNFPMKNEKLLLQIREVVEEIKWWLHGSSRILFSISCDECHQSPNITCCSLEHLLDLPLRDAKVDNVLKGCVVVNWVKHVIQTIDNSESVLGEETEKLVVELGASIAGSERLRRLDLEERTIIDLLKMLSCLASKI
eukprot:GHVP01053041.1.p1 GENE.GHVP01053041.1~~GHVP01053041.1.p1  ORF type:complete len:636 (+),score=108.20 GHVP01053041.1:1211-3118(+)